MSVYNCPRCGGYFVVDKVACGIFRHAYDTHAKRQVSPHASKEKIDKLMKSGRIAGCGAAIVIKDGVAYECDYKLKHSKEFKL